MLSLYLHLPFCAKKCNYCSFFVMPEEEIREQDNPGHDKEGSLERMKDAYLESLLKENATWKERFPQEEVRTIYIWWGTPFELGRNRLLKLIDTLLETWGSEMLEELTIEMNPDPMDEVVEFIKECGIRYPKLYRLRRSIGVQSFDDEILEASKRWYRYEQLPDFFRNLVNVKKPHVDYNFDFIAFGKFNKDKHGKNLLWSQEKLNFFKKLIDSHAADGFSVYTLELFPGSARYYQNKQPKEKKTKLHRLQKGDDAVYEEFELLTWMLTRGAYTRYELSNFARGGKRSIHNMVYRTMQPYIGMGISASSYLPAQFNESLKGTGINTWSFGTRFTNTTHWKSYLADERINKESIIPLDKKAYRIEQAFLGLRTNQGMVYDEAIAKELFIDWFFDRLVDRQEEWYLIFTDKKIALTSKGLDVYNTIITDLFKEF